jgi:hypothetical protein
MTADLQASEKESERPGGAFEREKETETQRGVRGLNRRNRGKLLRPKLPGFHWEGLAWRRVSLR